MIHALKLIIIAFTGFVLLYLSRFWIFDLWDRPGLFGWKQLPPNGGLLNRWLRQMNFEVADLRFLVNYELLIWAIGAFLVLTALQKLFDKLGAH